MRTAAKIYSYHRNEKWSLFTRTLFLYPSIVSGGDSSRFNLQRCRSLRAFWIASKSSFCASKYVKRWQDSVTSTMNRLSAVLREILRKETWATYRGWSFSPLPSKKSANDLFFSDNRNKLGCDRQSGHKLGISENEHPIYYILFTIYYCQKVNVIYSVL